MRPRPRVVIKSPVAIHPGEILREEFIKPMGISQYRLAKSLNVPPRRINEIVHKKRAISADTALRLARFFKCSCKPATTSSAKRRGWGSGSPKR
jgi:addiction module HigA family antidote